MHCKYYLLVYQVTIINNIIQSMPYTRTVSEATKAKIAAANKGKPRSETTKAKISASKKGTKHTEATKAKIANTIMHLWAKVPKVDKALEL